MQISFKDVINPIIIFGLGGAIGFLSMASINLDLKAPIFVIPLLSDYYGKYPQYKHTVTFLLQNLPRDLKIYPRDINGMFLETILENLIKSLPFGLQNQANKNLKAEKLLRGQLHQEMYNIIT